MIKKQKEKIKDLKEVLSFIEKLIMKSKKEQMDGYLTEDEYLREVQMLMFAQSAIEDLLIMEYEKGVKR